MKLEDRGLTHLAGRCGAEDESKPGALAAAAVVGVIVLTMLVGAGAFLMRTFYVEGHLT